MGVRMVMESAINVSFESPSGTILKKDLEIQGLFFACRKVEKHRDPVGAGLLAMNDDAVSLLCAAANLDINRRSPGP